MDRPSASEGDYSADIKMVIRNVWAGKRFDLNVNKLLSSGTPLMMGG